MIKRKLFVVFTVFLILCAQKTVKAQSIVPIVLNEYSTSNVGTPVDNFGQQSDWVEIYNAHTALVSLGGYYLSNDRNNLYKWKFPSTFIMGVGTYSVVWLSGKNTVSNGNYHANFTLDQCKNQWLILTSPQGVIRDSIAIQHTKAGHSWGRVDYSTRGVGAWKLYTAHSFMFANPLANNYKGYAIKPYMRANPLATPNPAASPAVNSGGFFTAGATIVYFTLGSDTNTYYSGSSCFDIWYTTNGDYPVVGGSTSTQYIDKNATPLTLGVTTMVRAISVVKPIPPFDPNAPPSVTLSCEQAYLPSFCETNTYFVNPEHQTFDSNFGIVSIALDVNDTAWFNSNGNPPNTPIHVEYYENKKQVSEGYGIINRSPNEEWRTSQKGFDITIDDRYGYGCNFEGNIFNVEGFSVSTRTVFPTLQLYAGDLESHSPPLAAGTASSFGTGLRDVIMQSLASKYNLDVNPLHVKPVVAFKNGAYWGVFTLKEIYDKYYESYYNSQPVETLDLAFYHNTDGYVGYPDGSVSRSSPLSTFKTSVYDVATTKPMTGPFYKNVINLLDKESFIDYMIVNGYAMNSSLWNYNIAYAKGGDASKPGNKWHYYLWNMPTIFNFTAVATNTLVYDNPYYTACSSYSATYQVSPQQAGNGHGMIMRALMNTTGTGNKDFQQEYKTRYQDLMNTALKCDNILSHFDFVAKLYRKEMLYHEDPANLSPFASTVGQWDTNMVHLRTVIQQRCFFAANSLKMKDCFGLQGPYDMVVDVEPVGSGNVQLNSIKLDSYPWTGSYYGGLMSFKAIPTNTTYIFDHWEFQNYVTTNLMPLSLDSVSISFGPVAGRAVAVFTDKSADLLAGINVPTGFTPNGDGNNDIFKPLGSALFTSEYEMTIWNRWGQEVFRSTEPADGWDGNYKGQQSVTGVYAYIIKYKNIYGESKLLKGNVTLTR